MEDNIIFGSLYYTIEEMNDENSLNANYIAVKINIDKENKTGTATIRELKSGKDEEWSWDEEIWLWVRNEYLNG